MILALTLVAMLLVTISKYQTNQASNNQFQTSLHFIEVISKDLGVDKSEVYVNTSAATDGALIKVGSNFYRAMKDVYKRQDLGKGAKLRKESKENQETSCVVDWQASLDT